jgi:hypothetical protein
MAAHIPCPPVESSDRNRSSPRVVAPHHMARTARGRRMLLLRLPGRSHVRHRHFDWLVPNPIDVEFGR